VGDTLGEFLRTPALIPQLHQAWAQAKPQDRSGCAAQQTHLLQRRQRLERQSQRLLDAYQTEIISLEELQGRRRKMTAELHQIAQELQQLLATQQQTLQWQQVIEPAETLRHLVGENLDQLSFEERQAVVQCLMSKVVIPGEEVDIYYVLPFGEAPQGRPHTAQSSEGTPGQFYRLRLAERTTVSAMEILIAYACPYWDTSGAHPMSALWATDDQHDVDAYLCVCLVVCGRCVTERTESP
jgi:hypothetical protein